MSKKLAAKASLIQLPSHDGTMSAAPTQPHAPNSAEAGQPARDYSREAKPRTAPGSMALFMATQSSAVKEAELLKDKLKAFDGAVPMRALDAQRVRPSRWANRHRDALSDKAFQELKLDIAAAGGNVQPISVRPVTGDSAAEFEIVFGHRRHQACMELGLAVRAVVAEVDDRTLFEAMERENRARKSLSAWEQGMMYRRALDGGLYPSQRRLAESLGVDLALVSKSLALARLPEAVIGAFASPLDVQFRWAQPLGDALQRDPEGLVARAKTIGRDRAEQALSARQVLERLLGGTGVLNGSTPGQPTHIGRPGKGAWLERDGQGRAVVRFDAHVLTAEREQALVAWLQAQLKGA